ncbi:unnamed protein product [Ectocarpus sp. 12 AP-2014]
MPSSHPPIKKYNYERSLFRWLMSRHPEQFEEHGIKTKTLERAPLAREAFYTSSWPGARALIQTNEDNKAGNRTERHLLSTIDGRSRTRAHCTFQRTELFDQIIERGLDGGDTRFSVEHLENDERSTLGITQDSATGRYRLQAYSPAE